MKRIKTDKTKLNLGCGDSALEDYFNIDAVNLQGVNLVWNLNNFPWPFKSNAFEEIYISHFLEDVNDLEKTLKEIKRVSKKGGIIKIRVPHFSCGVSYRDPTHKRLFSYFTFDYFTDKCFYAPIKFKIVKRKLNFTRFAFTPSNYIINPLINLNQEIYERFFCWMLPCAECTFELKVIK